METQNNDPTTRIMAPENMDFDGEPETEASPSGSVHSAPLPRIEGDVGNGVNLAALRRRRPPFDWTDERTLQLIQFFRAMYRKHKEMLTSLSTYDLKTNYHAGYEEVRNLFTNLWEVRLSQMLAKYEELIPFWTQIWKVLDATAAEATADLTTQIERQGMTVEIFLSLKDSIEERHEVNIQPLITAWNGVLPSKRVGRIVGFLLEVTHQEFEARQACATTSRARKGLELRYRRLQEHHRFTLATLQHYRTNEQIQAAMELLDGEISEVDRERVKHLNQIHLMNELLNRRHALRHTHADLN